MRYSDDIIENNLIGLIVNLDTARKSLSTMWANLRIPLTGQEWWEAEQAVKKLEGIIDIQRVEVKSRLDDESGLALAIRCSDLPRHTQDELIRRLKPTTLDAT